MKPASEWFYKHQRGLIRVLSLCLVVAVMAAQIAHWSTFESSDEMTQVSAVAGSLVSNITRDDKTGTSTHSCPSGPACHAPVLLVSVEFGPPVVAVLATKIPTQAQMGSGQSVDVPVPPPLTRRA